MALTKRPFVCNSVFLADDDEDDVFFFRDAFITINPKIQVTTVQSGSSLLHLLESFEPDILFLDMDMPGMTGLEVLKTLREKPQFQSLPIIIFSSASKPSNIDTAFLMGANLFFVKPQSFQALKESITGILNLDWQNPNEVREQYCVNGRYVAYM